MDTKDPDFFEYSRIRRKKLILKYQDKIQDITEGSVEARLMFYEMCDQMNKRCLQTSVLVIKDHPNLINSQFISPLTYLYYFRSCYSSFSHLPTKYIFKYSNSSTMRCLLVYILRAIIKHCEEGELPPHLSYNIDWGKTSDAYSKKLVRFYNVDPGIHSLFFRYLPTMLYDHEGIKLRRLGIADNIECQLLDCGSFYLEPEFSEHMMSVWRGLTSHGVSRTLWKKINRFTDSYIYKNIPYYNCYLLLLNEYRSRKEVVPNAISKLPKEILELIFSFVFDGKKY